MGYSSQRCYNKLSLAIIAAFLISYTKEVQLLNEVPSDTISKSSEFNVCLKPDRPSGSLVTCLGHQALRKLQDLEEREEFNLADGVNLKRDEAGPRDISNFLDRDPTDFRSLIEGASTLMSRRAMQWDMSYLHPGLTMRIGPTLTANGVLEFVIDPRVRDRESVEHETSTARLIARNLLVPFLLGFKFQLSTLLPILFGLIVLFTKKALILSKVALVAASVFGLHSLGGAGGGSHGYGGYGGYSGYGGSGNGGYGGGLSVFGNRYQSDQFYKNSDQQNSEDTVDPYYAQSSSYNPGHPTRPEDLRDRLESLFITKRSQDKSGVGIRNFSWNQ